MDQRRGRSRALEVRGLSGFTCLGEISVMCEGIGIQKSRDSKSIMWK
jgi:hypothetical protein